MCQPITKSQGREYLLSGNKAIKYETYIITWMLIITPQLIQSTRKRKPQGQTRWWANYKVLINLPATMQPQTKTKEKSVFLFACVSYQLWSVHVASTLSNQVSFTQLFVMSLWCCWSCNSERPVALLGRWLPIEGSPKGDSLQDNGKHTNFRSSRQVNSKFEHHIQNVP